MLSHHLIERKKKREHRPKDIPDSWIFEAVVDLARKYPDLIALVSDGRLSSALKAEGIRVVPEHTVVLEEIEASNPLELLEDILKIEDSISVAIQDSAAVTPSNELEHTLNNVRGLFKDFDSKVVGFVAYLGAPTKEELFDLLSQSGLALEMARNIAERLALSGVIKDTGDHYLVENKTVAEQAAKYVEPEIIKLIQGS